MCEARPSLARLFLAVYTPIVTFHPENALVFDEKTRGEVWYTRRDSSSPFGQDRKSIHRSHGHNGTGVCSRILTIPAKVDWPTPLL